MNFKTTIAAVLVATASLFSGGEALAETGGVSLFKSLDQANISVGISECEDDSRYGYFAYAKGKYGGHIQICTNVATTESARWETLRHESVHVAQMCRSSKFQTGYIAKQFKIGNFDTVKTLSWLKTNHSEADWRFVVNNYEKHDWLIEIEAFTLQNTSNKNIANLVNRQCAS